MISNEKTKSKSSLAKKLLLVVGIILFILISVSLIIVFSIVADSKLNKQLLTSFTNPIEIYDSNSEKLAESLSGSPCVKLADLNKYTYLAFVDIEDKTFFEHNGVNVGRMIKALGANLANGEIVQGASTISQQLIKNTHLSNEKTYSRKIKEIALALELEKEFSKEEILEMYLNAIYFGNGCYGIESASNFYFNKKATMLSLNESAILAGIIKSPSHYDPINYPENIKKRKNLILSKMYEAGNLSEGEFTSASSEGINLCLNVSSELNNQCYYSSAIEEASEILNISPTGLASKGYKIYTYFDAKANKILSQNAKNDTNALHNAIIVDNKTKGIIAFNSSLKYGSINIKRTPASTLKPILVYAPAIEGGIIQPASILTDERTTFAGDYSPKNLNDKYYGEISASEALAKSLNIPAVKLLERIGVKNAKRFAGNFGINFDETDSGLSLALGSMKHGITIKELVDAYSPFASLGHFSNSSFIREIRDANNNVVYSHSAISQKVLSEESAFLVGEMMRDTTQRGTCTAMKSLGYEIHAKSGTNGAENSSKNTDSICLAQTTSHTACLWYFSKDYKSANLLENASISGLSPTIRLKNVFVEIYSNSKPENFEKPQSVTLVELDLIDYQNGKLTLSNKNTPSTQKIKAYFNEKYAPKELSLNFRELIIPILNFKQNANAVDLTFFAMPSQEYELIHEEYENEKIINSQIVSNISKSSECENVELTIDLSKEHKFFLNTKFINSTNSSTSNIIHIKSQNEPQTIGNSFWFNFH